MTPAKTPNALTGSIGLAILAIKATEVVLDVTAIALAALLNEYAILLCKSSLNIGMCALYLHPSMNTNISSAAIPSTMKTIKT